MDVSDNVTFFCEQLDEVTSCFKNLYDSLKKLKDKNVKEAVIEAGNKYLIHGSAHFEELKMVYGDFERQINSVCEQYIKKVDYIKTSENNEARKAEGIFNEIKKEMEMKREKMKNISLNDIKEPSFIYKNGKISNVNIELVKNHPRSYFYEVYMSGNRTNNGDIFIDENIDGENDELIIKYMMNDESLIEDLKKTKKEKKSSFIHDLDFLQLPVKVLFFDQIGINEDYEKTEAWKTRRAVMVNGKNATEFNRLLMKYNLFNPLFDNSLMKNIYYSSVSKAFYIDLKMSYLDGIEDYLKNGKKINKQLIKKSYYYQDSFKMINELKMIGIELNGKEKREICACFQYLRGSAILLNDQYDYILREWLGYGFQMKLIYRASDHDYTAESFHECCDDKRPTLVIVKSSGGYIFGGFTTQSWEFVDANVDDCIFIAFCLYP